jgi:hypothetical protein
LNKKAIHFSHIYEWILKFENKKMRAKIFSKQIPTVIRDDFFSHYPHLLINSVNSNDKTEFLKFLDVTCDDSLKVKSSFLNSPFSDYQKNIAVTLSSKLESAKFWFILSMLCKDFKFHLTSTPIVTMNKNSTKLVTFNILVTYILLFDNNINMEQAKPFVIEMDDNNNNIINNDDENPNVSKDIENHNVLNHNVLLNKTVDNTTNSLVLNFRKLQISRTFIGKATIHFSKKNLVTYLAFSV